MGDKPGCFIVAGFFTLFIVLLIVGYFWDYNFA